MQHGQDNALFSVCVLVGTAVACAVAGVVTRAANQHRNREEALARLQGYSEAEFRRRYRMSRERFNNIAEIIRPQVEPTTPLAIARAIASSGSAAVECGVHNRLLTNMRATCSHSAVLLKDLLSVFSRVSRLPKIIESNLMQLASRAMCAILHRRSSVNSGDPAVARDNCV